VPGGGFAVGSDGSDASPNHRPTQTSVRTTRRRVIAFVRGRWYTFDQTFNRIGVRTITVVEEAFMSVAAEFAPDLYGPGASVPDRPRLVAVPAGAQPRARLATVTVLHAPARPDAPGVRLTRRGVVVLALAVVALGIGLVWLARASAPAPAPVTKVPRVVTVAPGDTLWSIASRVAPDADPRAEVAALQERNQLSGVDLVPGQVLVLR
jgi:hypothetical protein